MDEIKVAKHSSFCNLMGTGWFMASVCLLLCMFEMFRDTKDLKNELNIMN